MKDQKPKRQKIAAMLVASALLMHVHPINAQSSGPAMDPAGHGAEYPVNRAAEDFSFYVPNAFTPNGDGLNDVFIPKGNNFANYALKVYDSRGQKLFESNDPQYGWDGAVNGSPCEKGVYVYQVVLSSHCTGDAKSYAGTVTLLRGDRAVLE